MRLMLDVARAYPARTLITLFALLLAGIVQGLSLSALLPMLQVALGQQNADSEVVSPRWWPFCGMSGSRQNSEIC